VCGSGHWASEFGKETAMRGDRLGQVELWNTATGEIVSALATNTIALSVAFSPRGDRIAAGTDKGVRLWCANSGKDESAIIEGAGGAARGVSFSPDGERLASVGEDGTIRLWHLSQPQPRTVYRGREKAVCVAFDPSGMRIASGGADGTVKLWFDPSAGPGAPPVPSRFWKLGNSDWKCSGVAFDPSGTLLAAVGDRGLCLLDAVRGGQVYEQHTHGGKRVSFSSDGSLLAINQGTTISLHTAGDGKFVRYLEGLSPNSYDVAFSPDGKNVAACSGDGPGQGEVRVWECSTGKNVRTLKIDDLYLWAVAWSPDGNHVAAAGGRFARGGRSGTFGGVPNDIWVWDVRDGKLVHRLKGHSSCIWDIAFSNDGRRLASAAGLYQGQLGSEGAEQSGTGAKVRTGEGEIKLWDMTSGLEVLSLPLAICPFSVSFSPDGRWLACAGATWLGSPDGTVMLFGPTPGREDLTLTVPGNGPSYCVAFSPDGKRIAVASRRSAVSVWNIDEVAGTSAALIQQTPDGGTSGASSRPAAE
jgi:WD40 repeat protein